MVLRSSLRLCIFDLPVFLQTLLIYIISLFLSRRQHRQGMDLALPTAGRYQLNVILKLEGSWEYDTLVYQK